VVVGGGPGGAAAAVMLAQAGREVLVIERQTGPHDKVCGEFLSDGALAGLHALGVDARSLGAVPVRRIALSSGARRVDAALAFAAAGLSRRVLDEALLQRAVALGATLQRGVAVRSVRARGDVLELRTEAGQVSAAQIILATGKHELHGRRRRSAHAARPWTGVKMQIRPGVDVGDRIELELFAGGYGGLQPIEAGRVTLCIAGRDRELALAARDWAALRRFLGARAPRLSSLVDSAEPCWARPLAISGIPYGFLHRHLASDEAGVMRVGDQFAVIPSFCGDGIALALASGAAAAATLLAGGEPSAFHRAMRGRLAPSFRLAGLLGALVGSRVGRGIGLGTLRCFPTLLRWTASSTRVTVPDQRERRASTG
jgi:flavin-dependent dehydrogenase